MKQRSFFKTAKLIAMLLISSIGLSSCCSNEKCECEPTPAPTIELMVKGYEKEEVDTFIIKRYLRGTNFAQMQDSAIKLPSFKITQGDTMISFFNLIDYNENNQQSDFEMINLHDNKQVNVTDIRVALYKDNGCCKCDSYKLENYTINSIHSFPFSAYFILKK